MDMVTLNDFHGQPLHTVSLILYLALGPNDKLVSPLSPFLGHPGFKVSIRLLSISCLSMYGSPSVQLQWDRSAVRVELEILHN